MFGSYIERLGCGRWHGIGVPQPRQSLRGLGQAGRGREDVPAGTAMVREGIGSRLYINTRHGPQFRQPLRGPVQAGRGGEDVPTGALREGEGIWFRLHINTYFAPLSRSPS
jgi:hypothetical protein